MHAPGAAAATTSRLTQRTAAMGGGAAPADTTWPSAPQPVGGTGRHTVTPPAPSPPSPQGQGKQRSPRHTHYGNTLTVLEIKKNKKNDWGSLEGDRIPVAYDIIKLMNEGLK